MPDSKTTQEFRKLVIITGSGRSGTSTVSGALKLLGLYIPQPEVKADSSNPRGFFEQRWAVDFHKRILAEAGVRTLDARPMAWKLMDKVTSRPALKVELEEWFAGQLQGPQVVVKDPRIFWLRGLWVEVADDLEVYPSFLTMLRHPAEVVGSRDMHYLKLADAERRLARETGNVAGWVNVALINERASRISQRAFAHYADLITDWRMTMQDVGRQLDLTYDTDLAGNEHHDIDDFIDVSLRRAQITFDDLDIPAQLRRVAETVWDGLSALVENPYDPDAMKSLDAMNDEYIKLHAHSAALVQDHTNSAVEAARRQARRKATKGLEQALAQDQAGASIPRRVVRRLRGGRAER